MKAGRGVWGARHGGQRRGLGARAGRRVAISGAAGRWALEFLPCACSHRIIPLRRYFLSGGAPLGWRTGLTCEAERKFAEAKGCWGCPGCRGARWARGARVPGDSCGGSPEPRRSVRPGRGVGRRAGDAWSAAAGERAAPWWASPVWRAAGVVATRPRDGRQFVLDRGTRAVRAGWLDTVARDRDFAVRTEQGKRPLGGSVATDRLLAERAGFEPAWAARTRP